MLQLIKYAGKYMICYIFNILMDTIFSFVFNDSLVLPIVPIVFFSFFYFIMVKKDFNFWILDKMNPYQNYYLAVYMILILGNAAALLYNTRGEYIL